MNAKFSKVLILSNIGIDFGDPFYRVGTYRNYLIPYARAILSGSDADVRLLANEHVTRVIGQDVESAGIGRERLLCLSRSKLNAVGLGDFMIRSYRHKYSDAQKKTVHDAFDASLANWEPDLILCWEAPTTLLRSRYPDALVLDLMPSFFMRAPYPKMIQVDPGGLYGSAWYVANDTLPRSLLTHREKDGLDQIRKTFINHFESIGVERYLQRAVDLDLEKKNVIVPLQISSYFGWKENVEYSNQFEYIEDVLSNEDEESNVIITQYISELNSERVINSRNVEYLSTKYQNFVFDESFNRIDNISQYILPFCSGINSISSTLGLQGLFLGKELKSNSTSHLGFLASLPVGEAERIVDFTFARGALLHERILAEDGYLVKILQEYWERRFSNGPEKFPEASLVDNSPLQIERYSSVTASERRFRSFSGENKGSENLKEYNIFDKYDIISFDVFDTLLCRNVLEPRDVFELMGQALISEGFDFLPDEFFAHFAEFRVSFEREARKKLDLDNNKSSDEVDLLQVYREILRTLKVPEIHAETLIEFEERIELECLRMRPAGFDLFQAALRRRKKVILISDFLHSEAFVNRALLAAGYSGWDALYVSSSVGKKKHSGELFSHVCTDLEVKPSEILHIGDNLYGDLRKANERGLTARWLPSGPLLAKEFIRRRNHNTQAFQGSLVTKAILVGHANGRTKMLESNSVGSLPSLIDSYEDLGFLIVGPILHFFSEWLLKEARNCGVKQIVFFARDTHLAFRQIRERLNAANGWEMSACYLPVSRAALVGTNIFSPEDLLRVRIDDFSRNRLLIDLLCTRFPLRAEEISETALRRWTQLDRGRIFVKSLSQAAIYDIAMESARENWGAISVRLEDHRATVGRMMEQCGVDLDRPSITVDFGYKGSIHKQLAHLFRNRVEPRFFMSFANRVGHPPVADLKSFYKSNGLPKMKAEVPFLRYNLILETLVNEPVGSAIGYRVDATGVIEVERIELSQLHAKAIERIHAGALAFSRYWLSHCEVIDRIAVWESDMMDYFFVLVMSRPTHVEAKLLSALEFDNAFAGHAGKRIVRSGNKGVWPEGAAALNPREVRQTAKWRRLYKPIVRLFVERLGTSRDVELFDRDPRGFFRDLKEPRYRVIGRLLYP